MHAERDTLAEYITNLFGSDHLAPIRPELEKMPPAQEFIDNLFEPKVIGEARIVNGFVLNAMTTSYFGFRIPNQTNNYIFDISEGYRYKPVEYIQAELDEDSVSNSPTEWIIKFQGYDEEIKIFEEVTTVE